MSKNQFRFSKIEIHVLKVHMNCQGCMERVRKLLKRIEGVYKVDIDAEEQKVTIIGNVDSSILIKKLAKLGKQAQLWASTSKQDEDDEEQTLRKNKGNYLEDAIDPSYTFQNEYTLPICDSEFSNPTLLECYLAQENGMSSGFRHVPVTIAAAQKARGPMVSMAHDVVDIQDYQFS
ncbi:heavy metal-associated isoprenylated plant protein 32-like [Cucurbita maxima]|uniref:Heavy metal-associated isoprenylated plant protein 32-like n=1 Tax=Cucurbita maxima TaxID=3661 RepID=A0A6J1KBU2_CUCMA|nr:heavy metal-associated isoprenylated plant protein 32-like [Cucurbita maxima]